MYSCSCKFQGLGSSISCAPHPVTEHLDVEQALSAANGRYLGGGLQFSPLANVTDGLLSAVLVENVSVLRFARYIHRIRAGRHIQGLGESTLRLKIFVPVC